MLRLHRHGDFIGQQRPRNYLGVQGILFSNAISDISPLSGLVNLTRLDLRYNPELRDIQALLENPGIGEGDILELRHTIVTCEDQAMLAEKGVEVRTELFSACN